MRSAQRLVRICARLSIIAVFAGCLNDPDPGKSVPSGELLESRSYAIASDSTFILPSDPGKFCRSGQLVTDSGEAPFDTLGFRIRHDTLIVFDANLPLVDSSVRIRNASILIRQGGGAGLEGFWGFAGTGFEVVSGTLSDSGRTKLERRDIRQNKRISLQHASLRFRNGTLEFYQDSETAAIFIFDWTDATYGWADSSVYDVEVRPLEKHVVELRGRKTGDTVRITLDNNGDRHYESTSPSYLPTTYRAKPVSCPNDFEPSWYPLFLDANQKATGLPKKPGIGQKRPNSAVYPDLPLKNRPFILN